MYYDPNYWVDKWIALRLLNEKRHRTRHAHSSALLFRLVIHWPGRLCDDLLDPWSLLSQSPFRFGQMLTSPLSYHYLISTWEHCVIIFYPAKRVLCYGAWGERPISLLHSQISFPRISDSFQWVSCAGLIRDIGGLCWLICAQRTLSEVGVNVLTLIQTIVLIVKQKISEVGAHPFFGSTTSKEVGYELWSIFLGWY